MNTIENLNQHSETYNPGEMEEELKENEPHRQKQNHAINFYQHDDNALRVESYTNNNNINDYVEDDEESQEHHPAPMDFRGQGAFGDGDDAEEDAIVIQSRRPGTSQPPVNIFGTTSRAAMGQTGQLLLSSSDKKVVHYG